MIRFWTCRTAFSLFLVSFQSVLFRFRRKNNYDYKVYSSWTHNFKFVESLHCNNSVSKTSKTSLTLLFIKWNTCFQACSYQSSPLLKPGWTSTTFCHPLVSFDVGMTFCQFKDIFFIPLFCTWMRLHHFGSEHFLTSQETSECTPHLLLPNNR